MAILPITNDGLGRAFRTALLLTASAERAEAAVLEAIATMDPLEFSDEALLREAMAASITSRFPEAGVEEQEHGSSLLPLALRGILRLPRDLRQCFVLRVLVGLPREVCALILQTATRQRIDELVWNAVQALAVLPQGEQSTWVSVDIMSLRH